MGRVKTRLGRDIGAVRATSFYRTTARNVIGRLARDTRWETVLAVTPDISPGAQFWPPRIARVPQGDGDLGDRMWRISRQRRAGPVLVVGTDIPGLTPSIIASAIRALAGHDGVLCPAGDGGYWCVGFSRLRAATPPFDDVRWSHPETLSDTMRGFGRARVAIGETVPDVDSGAEFASHGAQGALRVRR